MKKTNKLFCILGTAAIAATPTVALSSCNNNQLVSINEKAKTVSLNPGDKKAIFEFTLSQNINKGEKITVTVPDVKTPQNEFTIKVEDANYSEGSNVLKVTVAITPLYSQMFLDDNATFKFNLKFVKTNYYGETLFETKINNFSMQYHLPTVGKALTIKDADKDMYTQPKEDTYIFVFDVLDGVEVDDTCTFACEVKTKAGSTADETVVYKKTEVKTQPKKQVCVTFRIKHPGVIPQYGDYATFDFTLLCMKNGIDLWKQSFNDFTIRYMDELLTVGSAQRKMDATTTSFVIKVNKNDSIHLNDFGPEGSGKPYTYKVTPEDSSVTMNVGTIIEVGGSPTSFEIPITIGKFDTTKDHIFKYTLDLTTNIKSQKFVKSYTETVSYFTSKVEPDSSDSKTKYFFNEDYTEFKFNLKDQTYAETDQFDGNAINYDTYVSTRFGRYDATKNQVIIKAKIFGEGTEGETSEFHFKISYMSGPTEKQWTEAVTPTPKFKLIRCIIGTIPVKQVSTDTEGWEKGKLELTLSENHHFGTGTEEGTIVPGSITSTIVGDISCWKEVTGATAGTVTEDVTNNKISIPITLQHTDQLTSGASATFTLNVKGKIILNSQQVDWSISFEECRVTVK